jgi:GTP-binding protein Era
MAGCDGCRSRRAPDRRTAGSTTRTEEDSIAKLKEVRAAKIPRILNKIDLIDREKLLALTAKRTKLVRFERTFMISATNGDGVPTTSGIDFASGTLPKGPWLYPEDEISDVPMRLMAAEITREKLFLRLHDELPYQSTVETDSWKEKKDGSVRIEQTIYVERDGQKKIVLGEKGQTIKSISFGRPQGDRRDRREAKVHLFLFVKVRENWSDDPERYREMGLEFPHEKKR